VKHVVSFSGGLCSFWAAWRVIQKYGRENVVLLFADTLIEDHDLYAFNEAAAMLLGVPITRVVEGRTPWELFRDEGMIGNNRFPICSVRLKREPLAKWFDAHCLNMAEEGQEQIPFLHDGRQPATLYLGFDWTEPNRIADMKAEHPLWRIDAPMQEEPIWDKCRMEREAVALGLAIPRLYKEGFPHNNCGGRCVRAGISHWVHLYRVRPAAYIEWMDEELETQRVLAERGISNAHFTVLKDRRGGETKPLALSQLRNRIEAGEEFPSDDWGGCGCGGATKAA
jgi:hypothetical protein